MREEGDGMWKEEGREEGRIGEVFTIHHERMVEIHQWLWCFIEMICERVLMLLRFSAANNLVRKNI